MTSPPDKLFRQGLEHYQKPAPGSAWDRIESGLDKKKHKSPWMKVAAGLLILIATSVVILQFNPNDTSIVTVSKESGTVSSEQLAVSSSERSEDPAPFGHRDDSSNYIGNRESSDVRREAVVNREALDARRESVGNRETSIVSREVINGRKSSRLQPPVLSSQSAVAIQKYVTSIESIQTETAEPVEKRIEPAALSKVEITTEISMTDNASDSKRTNITYTAEEVNAKYLKKETATEATPEKKNTSGLQKVIDLALDLKNEGSVLGDIREKKNEWLSFNIPSNKRETNK